jgi:hypothetical protein
MEHDSRAQKCAIDSPLSACRLTRERQMAWRVREAVLGIEGLLRRDVLVTFAGYHPVEAWNSRALTIFQPQWIVAAGNAMLAHRGIFVGAAVTELIIGLVLSYFGYAS